MFLVTGGAGFIGSHLVERLVRSGERVRVLDDFSSGRRQNLAPYLDVIDVIEGDVRDDAVVQRATLGIEVVLHQAAQVSVPRSIANPVETFAVNVNGTLNVLQSAHAAGCRRVVIASSCAVYGDTTDLPATELQIAAPLSPYALSKYIDEQLCALFTQLYGLDAVALRYFNVFGERQDPFSAYAAVIPRFLHSLQTGQMPVVYGDGEQSRDFIHVENVVDANLLAASQPGIGGRVFNIGSGRAISINQVLVTLGQLLGVPTVAHHRPARLGDIRHSFADITAARTALGYTLRVPFEDGLARIVRSGEVDALATA